jgi:HK97 family phage prohead protease
MKGFRTKNFSGYTPNEIIKAANKEESTLNILVAAMSVKDSSGDFIGIIDSDGDMVMPGSFNKTLKERGPNSAKNRVKHLWQHDRKVPIGIPIEMGEKEIKIGGQEYYGLVALTKFDSSTFSQDKYIQHIEGIITEFSFGYETIDSEKAKKEIDGGVIEYNKLTELKLWEDSSVTWGANEYTSLIKGLKDGKQECIAELEERFKILTGAMKSSRYNDDDKEQFELELLQIKEMVFSLLSGPGGPTRNDPPGGNQKDEVKEALELINSFRKQLKF